MKTLQFTIPPSGQVQFVDPQNPVVGTFFQNAIIQNNNAGSIRIGDSTVNATTGIVLTQNGTLTMVLGQCQRRTDMIFAYGTAGYVVDMMIVE